MERHHSWDIVTLGNFRQVAWQQGKVLEMNEVWSNWLDQILKNRPYFVIDIKIFLFLSVLMGIRDFNNIYPV